MSDQNGSRSGLQTAVDVARAGKAAARIAKAAAAAGLKGAAVAAAKEALPLLIKIAIAILVVMIVIPMLVFTALPNIFFGYDNSATQPIVDMTEKALSIGGAYMSVEDFEKTQMDSIVTGLVNQHENAGTQIDHIEVTSSFDDKDLCWLIAINSVAHEQDLDTMTVAAIQEMNISRIVSTPSVSSLVSGDGITVTTLKVNFEKLDPEQLMEDLGFDDDAKTWAGALAETLIESDALEKYKDHFSAYVPSYSGDNSYTGDVIYGGGSTGATIDNTIDTSGFVDPGTKNNLDLVAYAIQAFEHGWGYVWGTYGCVLTESVLDYKLEQYPDGVGNFEEFIRENWLGGRTTDCVGLIKGYGWLDPTNQSINYGTNGMPDYNADTMYSVSSEKGTMDTMPDIPGIALWKSGHIGVYIGGGMAIEAMGTKYGVVKTEVEGRGWEGWCKIEYIDYIEE